MSAAIEPTEEAEATLIVLDESQRADKAEYEKIIRTGMRGFLDVARALAHIRDQRLYLDEYTSFKAYCREKWRMSLAHSYRMIDVASVAENLSAVSPNGETEKILPNEAVARAYAPLTPREQRKVARMVDPENVTAPAVRKAADKIRGKRNGTKPTQKPKADAEIIDVEERLTRAEVANEILQWWNKNRQRLLEYPATSTDTIFQHLVKHFA